MADHQNSAYSNVKDVPPPGGEMKILVDGKNEAVLFPLYGVMFPIHVTFVKTVSYDQPDPSKNDCYIRLILDDPPARIQFSSHEPNTSENQPDVYLKEISYRSNDCRHIREVVEQIKTLGRNFVTREFERAKRTSLITQEKYVRARI